MLGGREKVGDSVINLGAGGPFPQKNRRLTFPFGPETDGVIDGRDTIHAHFVREIPLALGALGCALWDGGLCLTRWLYAHGAAVMAPHNSKNSKSSGGARILELGSGVGLAGIMAAHFNGNGPVVLTDYIPDALGNCHYNVGINDFPGWEEEVPEEFLDKDYNFDIGRRISVEFLDWDAEFAAGKNKEKESTASKTDTSASADAAEAKGSEDLPAGVKYFHHPPRSFDVILGAELTYNLLSCESLAFVIDRYLSDDGVFYEVLSNDRDGVSVFVKQIESLGFVTTREDVPKEFVGSYGTRKWSKQHLETYSLYSWRRGRGGQVGGGGAAAAAAAEVVAKKDE